MSQSLRANDPDRFGIPRHPESPLWPEIAKKGSRVLSEMAGLGAVIWIEVRPRLDRETYGCLRH